MSTSSFAKAMRNNALGLLLPLFVPWWTLRAQVQVTPRGTTAQVAPNSTGNTVNFTVKNTGFTTETFSVTCLTDQYIPTCSTSPSTVGPLSHNQTGTVTVTFSTGTSGSGLLTLDATGNTTHTTDEGWYNISPPPAPPAPLASDQPYGDFRRPQLCVTNCFENAVSYSTPAYVSMDVPRILTVAYRSNQAHPTATALIDAVDNGNPPALQYSLIVQKSGVNVTFNNGGAGTQELFFADGSGGTTRLVGTFDVSSLATGVYAYTATVKRWSDANNFTTSNLPFWLIVLNEGTSAYGAGWSIAGLQRLIINSSPAGVLAIDGAGGASFFRGSCPSSGTCTFASPSADFSVLKYTGSTATYQRSYPDGSVVKFGSDGKMTSSCDRFNNCTAFSFNGSGLLATVTDPTLTAISLNYAGSPAVLSTITVPGGSASRTSAFSISSGNLNSIQDPDNISTSFSYDSNHRLTQTTDRRGKAWNYAYKVDGTLDSLQAPTITIAGNSARPTTHFSAPSERITDSITRAGYGTATKLVPRSIDLRAAVTNPRGYTTSFTLDNFSAPILVQQPLSRTSSFSRNNSGLLTYSRSPFGEAVVNRWSGPDLISIYDSATMRRDTMMYEQTYHQLASRSDGVTKDSLSWSSGKLDWIDHSQSNGTYRTTYAYESISGRVTGRVTSQVDPRGHTIAYVYATSGLRNKVADSVPILQGGTPQVTRYSYDAAGRIVSLTDAASHAFGTAYDSLNRVVRQVGPISDTTSYGYDALYLTSVTDAKGLVYRQAPNAVGWDTLRVDPLGQIDSLKYDLNGSVVATVNRNLKTVSYQYDALDNPRMRIAGGDTTTFTIDSLGRFTKVANVESTDSTVFDAAGRVLAEVAVRGSHTYTRLSSYNSYSQRTKLVLQPWSDSVQFHFNSFLSLDTLTDFSGAKTILGYNNDLQVSGITLPASIGSITRDYPGEHTESQITYSNSSTNNLLGLDFSYSALGQVTHRVLDAQSTSTREVGRQLSFDAAGRLTGYANYVDSGATYTCSQPGLKVDPDTGEPCLSGGGRATADSAAYSYDKVGNRTDLGGAVIPGSNRLQSFNGYTFTYDSVGNLTQRLQSGNPVQTLSWNSLGQLVSVTTSGVTVTFGYDGYGRRVRKTTPSGTTYYVHDGDNLLAEVDANGNRVAEYASYPGIDTPHSMRRWSNGTPSTYYYASDVPGSVTGVIGSGGTLLSKYYYSPYGVLLTSDNYGSGTSLSTLDTVTNPLRFAAREYDGETGLYFMRARYYDAGLGRFISEDPAGASGDLNPYLYAGNDPVDLVDPFGLDGCTKALEEQGYQTVNLGTHDWCIPPATLPPVVVTADPPAPPPPPPALIPTIPNSPPGGPGAPSPLTEPQRAMIRIAIKQNRCAWARSLLTSILKRKGGMTTYQEYNDAWASSDFTEGVKDDPTATISYWWGTFEPANLDLMGPTVQRRVTRVTAHEAGHIHLADTSQARADSVMNACAP